MATFTVTSLSDVTDATDGVLTLREAAALANATAGADTIDFDTGVGGAIAGGGVIRLVQGEIRFFEAISLDGTGDITLSGDAGGNDILDANGLTDLAASIDTRLGDNTRILRQVSGDMTIDGLTFTGGSTNGVFGESSGGAIYADISTSSAYGLVIRDSSFVGNASGKGGAVRALTTALIEDTEFRDNQSTGSGAAGGAISSAYALKIVNSDFTGNASTGSDARGGAVFSAAATDISGSNFAQNSISGGGYSRGGGAISIVGDLALHNSTVSFNSATGNYSGSGGGLSVLGSATVTDSTIANNNASYSGGGLFATANITVENSTFTENNSVRDGGAIRVIGDLSVENSDFTGNEATARYSFGGAISAYSDTTIKGSRFDGNAAYDGGGALHTNVELQIDNSVFDANTSTVGSGGAVNIGYRGFTTDPTATTLITNSVFQNNSTDGAFAQGGAVFAAAPDVLLVGTSFIDNIATGGEAHGGALALGPDAARIYNSTFTGNSTTGFAGYGGAIYTSGEINLTNTTLAANTTAGGDGGAIFARSDLLLAYSTLTGNSVAGTFGTGGSMAMVSSGDLTLTVINSILAGNYSQRAGGADDLSITSLSGTINIVTPGSQSFFGSTAADASALFATPTETMIDTDGDGVAETGTGIFGGALADNGGQVQTVAIRPGGVATDGGPPQIVIGPSVALAPDTADVVISGPDASIGAANTEPLVADTIDLDGDGDTAEALPVDARGVARPFGAAADNGAFELQLNLIVGTTASEVLNGTTGSDSISALAGNDTLNGLAGADIMDGGFGNDRFFVDDAGDVVIEAADEGTDLLSTSVDFTLPDNVENGSTLGTGDVAITGNGLANFITGNAGANLLLGLDGADRLIAGLGDDTLEGGAGNDILQGQGGADRFVMTADNGDDQILDWEASTDLLDFGALGLRFVDLAITSSGNEALITFDDPAGGTGSVRLVDIDPEVLEIGIMADPGGIGSPGGIPLTAGTSGADNLAATNGDDDVVGLAGNDILNGRAGADTMLGGFGNDRYFLDQVGDRVIEQAFQGADQMDAGFSFTLAEHVENGGVLGGGDVDITGNGLGNFITGSAGSNVLRGEAGRDRLIGFAGEDTLIGGQDNDVLEGGADADLFVFEADSALNLITDFEVGVDLIDITALGLAFADLTIVDGPLGALVIFDATPGSIDLVQLQGVAAADLRLASFVTLFGENQPPIVGTQGNDVLFGSIEDDELQALGGNDLLNGLGGADLMLGGLGDDRYFVDDAGDVVVELAGEGTDLVSSFVDVVLSEHVENGSALGTGDVDLTGNGLDNALTGNAGANALSGADGVDNLQGLAGEDTIDGGAGADVLRGGLGADTFLFETGDGQGIGDQIIDFELGVDTIDLSATGLGFGDLTITDTGPNATVSYATDTITVFNTTAAQLDQNQFEF